MQYAEILLVFEVACFEQDHEIRAASKRLPHARFSAHLLQRLTEARWHMKLIIRKISTHNYCRAGFLTCPYLPETGQVGKPALQVDLTASKIFIYPVQR